MGNVLFRGAALIALLLSPNAFPQSPLERAVTLTREKRYAESAQILQSVPEPQEIHQRIAFHRLKAANASGTGDHPAAAREMSLALALAPSDPGLLAATALAELRANLLENAQRHAEQAGDNPTAKAVLGDTRIALAYNLIRHQDFAGAVDLLQKSRPLLPKSAKLLTLLGIAQYSTGYTEDAVSTLISALDLDSTEEPAYRCLSQIVLQSSASPPQAATAHLCRWNATVCSALKLRLSRETGDRAMQEEAIAGLKHAPPADPVAHCELARAWEWTGRLPEARAEMETCLKFAPTPQNHYRMGLIYKRLGLDDLSRKEMEIRQRLLDSPAEFPYPETFFR
jgi:Flp pilus assembly protein TadD